jgi:hypothetical protein
MFFGQESCHHATDYNEQPVLANQRHANSLSAGDRVSGPKLQGWGASVQRADGEWYSSMVTETD